MNGRGKQEQDKSQKRTGGGWSESAFRFQLQPTKSTTTMCKVSIIHVACQAGSEDGRNFPVENHEEIMNIFSRQFEDEHAQAAYCSNFLAEMGRRISPVNGIPMRQYACA